jgi:phytoene dehydrogenase-like protein
VIAARFGLDALRSASSVAKSKFRGVRARALFAGLAAHSILPLEDSPSAAFGLILGILAHAVGWPIVRGGTQNLADGLAAHLRSLGGEIRTDARVANIDELPPNSTVFCDVSPRALATIAGSRFTPGFRAALERYRYAPGVCKVDWALDAPIPWKAPECARAGTVHVGGTLEEIAKSERDAWNGVESPAPFVLLVQPTLFDPSRAPAGKHTAWGYCHVPNGSTKDMSGAIEAQIERFAPGFRERILQRSVMLPSDLEQHNANLVGGDVEGGAVTLSQLFTRPTWRLYATTDRRIYICSASTPPGGGVHGLCGHLAAKRALRK